MRRVLILSAFLCLTALFTAQGQGLKDIKINEILVKNVDNYMDGYGHRSSWIELHNTGHSTVDIGGCYFKVIVNGEEITYRIPTGDPNTSLPPLGYCVFFCEGTGTKGTFYTNFTLTNVEQIALYNSSGKGTPVDQVAIHYDEQLPDVSIGRLTMDDGTIAFRMLPQTTPNATNDTEPLMPRHEKFRQRDPYGGVMALMAIVVVLSILALLFILFKLLGNYMVSLTRKKTAASNPSVATSTEPKAKNYDSPYSGEEVAAIVMALQMYRDDLHDKESTVLTINRVARAYSPWSSKIYGLRQIPNLKK